MTADTDRRTSPDRAHGAARARLRGLRLQGFKSFAERTTLEFGAGISAVVGPNGSGKSNLADALRWALGEQGRALRSRKSEDVIFAGSEKRAALGMADVVLVLDNADGLLPVEYEVLEIGRRLYRSGENDYLLNRQRLRLRDLVDLLDGAHLADNAFLFIGQGMVDQALALRPEERRPLFEEVAGVRRHERRRRKAEEQLAEAEGNLARVEDILAELRPQARRLAVQAEQQANRVGAGEELTTALLASAHVRWHEAAARVATSARRLDEARTAAASALRALQADEEAATSIAASLGARSAIEAERREAHEAARAALTALELRIARLAGDVEALARDRVRLVDERSAAEADRDLRRRELAEPIPAHDAALQERAASADRDVADALTELTALRTADRARGDELAALRRAEAARLADLDAARRRLADVERRLADERARTTHATARRTELERAALAAREALGIAADRESAAGHARESARVGAEAAEGRRRDAEEAAAAAGARLASLRGRFDVLAARAAEDEARGIARAAKRRGGRRVDESLQVEPSLRAAVEAALGEAARGYLVAADVVPELVNERGLVVVERASDAPSGSGGSLPPDLRSAVAAAGGGSLGGAIRADATGAARLLLASAVWLPDLAAVLEVQPWLPDGWVAVVRDGSAVATRHTVTLGRHDAPLERRAELERLTAQLEAATGEADRGRAEALSASEQATAARRALDESRAAESAAAAARRRAEEEDRSASRALEAAAREGAWLEAQVERLATEAAGARGVAAAAQEAIEAAGAAREMAGASRELAGSSRSAEDAGGRVAVGTGADADRQAAIVAWEARVADLRAARDRQVAELAEQDRRRRDAEARNARAEAAVAMDEERIARADRELAILVERERRLSEERDALMGESATAAVREETTRAQLAELRAADAADRGRLAAAEAAVASARDRLRAADERVRAAEVGDLEARLALDAIREALLVELAGLGELALAGLGLPPTAADDAAALETALGARGETWAREVPDVEAPTPARLATLRRRYHEFGAANPFAVEEYAAVKERLATLEGQDGDLREAIARTRALIAELDTLISEQFLDTFRALETAFDTRFQQLFGGGFARLSLTDPGDLGATGVEIVARPPGKKAQALAMLSGGERALTAVALLFAMLEVRPVPFCVLDEVDAALDEANVGRFADALRGLADRTQFIVITHNRGTIEAADALYGVTVGDDSVSRVISLRLEEAQALAATATASRSR
ncbi:MAG TPA: chromosome segregation protein SMC [Candidatus Limnocylindrales bacterium]